MHKNITMTLLIVLLFSLIAFFVVHITITEYIFSQLNVQIHETLSSSALSSDFLGNNIETLLFNAKSNSLYMNLGSLVLIVIFLFGIMIMFVHSAIVLPIVRINLGMSDIAKGNIPRLLHANTKYDLLHLSERFNIMTEYLYNNSRNHERTLSHLTASEEKFYKAFCYCADVMTISRVSDKRYIEASEAFFTILGYKREMVIGRTANEFGLWFNAEERTQAYDTLWVKGFFRNLEVTWCTNVGEKRVGLCSGEVIDIGGETCALLVWHDITERKHAEELLRHSKDHLEVIVELRTQELQDINHELTFVNAELTDTLGELRKTQDYLIESEKMSALGTLVAGIAHEINTPIGIGVTVASHMGTMTEEFAHKYKAGSLMRKDMVKYLEDSQEAAQLLLSNLKRAAELVRSFKQVAVDQSSEKRRAFYVGEYLQEILTSLSPKIKKSRHVTVIDCPIGLLIDSYPGALYQIVTNLVMNSLHHAYDPGVRGTISIKVLLEEEDFVLTYQDDGKGIAADVLPRIFEPFFTTDRGSGGTGLGLCVLYNLVVRRFAGTVKCSSQPGEGTTFMIRFPLETFSS